MGNSQGVFLSNAKHVICEYLQTLRPSPPRHVARTRAFLLQMAKECTTGLDANTTSLSLSVYQSPGFSTCQRFRAAKSGGPAQLSRSPPLKSPIGGSSQGLYDWFVPKFRPISDKIGTIQKRLDPNPFSTSFPCLLLHSSTSCNADWLLPSVLDKTSCH